MPETPTIDDFMTPIPAIIEPTKSLEQAKTVMATYECRHLPVVNAEGHLVGVLSDRDIHLVESLGRRGKDHTVEEAMTQAPFTCGPEAHIHAVATEMADHKYGTAVIVNPDHPTRVVGVFTTVDALRALALYTGHGND
jgi:acetoin utilization protein AcuB